MENEDFLLLCLVYSFTVCFCSLLLSFFLDFLSCAISVYKYLKERWPEEWLAAFSGRAQHLQYLEWKEPSPGNAVVQTKTETTDWPCEVACVVNTGFVLLRDLYWGILLLPHWLSHLEGSWILLLHPSHESMNKAANKLSEETWTEFLLGY